MKLRYDPYPIYRFSKTPAGLYARQKWLGESETPEWKMDFQETVTALSADQLPYGSWYYEKIATIKRLFGLHLTQRSSTAKIDKALTWLLDEIDLRSQDNDIKAEEMAAGVDLTGLPFIPSRPAMLLTAATLFLATIFGRERDPSVLALYRWLGSVGFRNKGLWFDAASSHYIFRAVVVHPEFAQDKATVLAVERLAALQADTGIWEKDLPFYQTLNALAHLDLPQADAQLEKAFEWLFDNQNKDGTWSRSEPEWNTFLAIHALKNKGLL